MEVLRMDIDPFIILQNISHSTTKSVFELTYKNTINIVVVKFYSSLKSIKGGSLLLLQSKNSDPHRLISIRSSSIVSVTKVEDITIFHMHEYIDRQGQLAMRYLSLFTPTPVINIKQDQNDIEMKRNLISPRWSIVSLWPSLCLCLFTVYIILLILQH